MPPQVGKAGDGGRTPLPQAPPPPLQKNEVDATKAQNAANAPAADKPAQAQKQEDPKAAAKTAQASKQNAIDQKSQHDVRAQLVQKNLQNEIPGLAKQQAPLTYQSLEYRPMGNKTEDRKPGDPMHAAVETKTANSASPPKADHSARAARQHKSKPEKPKIQSDSAPAANTEFNSAHDSVRMRGKEIGIDKGVADAKRELLASRVAELAGRPQMLQGVRIAGKLYEVEHISPAGVNRTGTMERSRHNPPVVGDVVQHGRHTINTRAATASGLKERLTELNDGQLTPFEKKMVDDWHTPSKLGGIKDLVPIMESNDKEKGVQAYKMEEGTSGHKLTTYYDRQGTKLAQFRSELELTGGLDPVEWAAARYMAGRAPYQPGRGGAEPAAPKPAKPEPHTPSAQTGKTIPGYKPPIPSAPPYVQPGRRPTMKYEAPPPPSPKPSSGKVAANAPAGPPTRGTHPDSQPAAPAAGVSGRGKTLPGALKRPGGPLNPRFPKGPERPLPSGFPTKSGTPLTPSQVRQAYDARRVGWSMTSKEHEIQWKAANPTSKQPAPISFTTRDGRVQVDETRWLQSGQPPMWGNRTGDQVSSPPPPPDNN